MAVLPHYSPGYPEWDIAEQPRAARTSAIHAADASEHALPARQRLDVLESGMLRPKKSLLAVFGLTRHVDRVQPLTDLVPCENCSLSPLPVPPRRRTSAQPRDRANPELAAMRPGRRSPAAAAAAPKYGVNAKALQRWAEERLSLTCQRRRHDRRAFRYEGTTCTNMGRPLQFRYDVKLGPRERGYPIREQHCGPAAGDDGHTYMCRYMSNAGAPDGRDRRRRSRCSASRSTTCSTWQRPDCAAGCYCEPTSRKHKWGLVLETIHYALARGSSNDAAVQGTEH